MADDYTDARGQFGHSHLNEFRERIKDLEKIAKTIAEVELHENNDQLGNEIKEIATELGATEHKLLDAIGTQNDDVTDYPGGEGQLIREAANEVEQLTRELEAAIEKEGRTIRKQLIELAESATE